MVDTRGLSGAWRGRLIDIRGYEGEVALRLGGEGDKLTGVAEVSVGGTHASESHRMVLTGELQEDRLVLTGAVPGDVGVEFGIEADVFEMPIGGIGLRGTYEVGTKRWSSLRAGVITASKGMKPPSTQIDQREQKIEVTS